MTQEEKELLMKDLCARLPYGVMMKGVNEDFELSTSAPPKRLSYVLNSADFKPYLRPMSSMTEEEFDKVCSMNILSHEELEDRINYSMFLSNYTIETFDLFNSNHLDYRGLIPMGLALPATEGMYN